MAHQSGKLKKFTAYLRIKLDAILVNPVFISFLLTVLGMSCFLVTFFDLEESPLSIVETRKVKISETVDENLKTVKTVGEFEALENNLGSISLFFEMKGRVDNSITFKIKDKVSDQILYQNIYPGNYIQNYVFFPFGFPPLKDSQGREYVFELEVKQDSGIALVNRNAHSLFKVKYQYTRQDILAKPFLLTKILLDKFRVAGEDITLLLSRIFSFITFLSPAFVVIYFGKVRKKSTTFSLKKAYTFSVTTALIYLVFIQLENLISIVSWNRKALTSSWIVLLPLLFLLVFSHLTKSIKVLHHRI